MDALKFSLNLLGGLGVFLYGMKIMSEGLQKVAGDRLRKIISTATGNRFSATLAGFIVTCFVQSSSATTVMIVSFCSAGLLTLTQSLGMVFGANIGTTITAWIVSLLGFKIKITAFALPAIGIGFFSQFIKRWKMPHRIGEVLVGFGLLFLGLFLIKDAIPNLTKNPMVMDWLTTFDATQLGPRVMVVLIGTVLTMIFQSSSAVMVVTIAAAASGLINFNTAVALVLGENIGTTLTANIASIGTPTTSKRAARGHFLFNMLGVTWAIFLFNPYIRFVDMIIPGDPFGVTEDSLLVAVPTHTAAFHTIFNVTNTLVALIFIKPMVRLIEFLVPDKSGPKEHELHYISSPFSETPELALPAAQKEVDRMAGVVLDILHSYREVLNDKGDTSDKIEKMMEMERTTDVLEHEINQYLSKLAHAHLSTATNKKVLSLISMINDLERMGDHGEKLAKLMKKLKEGNENISEAGKEDLNKMALKAIDVTKAMKENILHSNGHDPLPPAIQREKELNDLRFAIRDSHINRITEGKCSPNAGILFTDMITSLEKMGDHAFNVVEASVGVK